MPVYRTEVGDDLIQSSRHLHELDIDRRKVMVRSTMGMNNEVMGGREVNPEWMDATDVWGCRSNKATP